ncbi:MAG: hypothetical protein GY790_10425 [Bacteroidetes bacterium]|nr:hypothetical protein [Bacteroidota bacterium]
MLSYKGEISDEIMMPLLAMTERKLEMSGAKAKTKAKVFNVIVECLQNVTRHTRNTVHKKAAMFLLGGYEDGFVIYSGNAIRADKVLDLKTKLLKVNTMTQDELKEFYKLWINSQEFSDMGGAGLGFIDMARKTGNPLDFDFEPIDDEYYFFSLKTLVNNR